MEINEKRRELKALITEERGDYERVIAKGQNFEQTDKENDFKRSQKIDQLTQDVSDWDQANMRAQARAAALASAGDGGSEQRGHVGAPDVATKQADIFKRYLRRELDLSSAAIELRGTHSAGVWTAGGALVTPVEVARTIIQAIDDATFIRSLATIYPLEAAASLGVPTIETDPADADWTGELATGNEGDIGFGGRELKPNPIAKIVKFSKELTRMVPNFDTLAMNRIAYKFAVTQEKAYLVGDGIGKPLGMLVGSAQGIPTSRDVTLGGAGVFTFDGIYNVEATMKAGYRAKMVWVTNKAHLNSIRKLKDSQNRYLIDINTANNGGIAQLVNRPLYLSEYFPTATTAGQYGILLGDLSYYWIAESMGFTTQVLNELYATSNSTAIIARQQLDGMPVLAEAFARGVFA